MGRGASIKVGEHAVLRISGRAIPVTVVEDRGKLAPGRTRLLRLGVDEADPPREMELSEDTFDQLLIDDAA
ncbi:MAG TPA: hypothetical protein VKV21_03020 [Solirubrobacteraceae bacterium]|jgi:hypothetical protein|nr:hypothetical protein [Solirubrobacteraceae bacterium]